MYTYMNVQFTQYQILYIGIYKSLKHKGKNVLIVTRTTLQ